MIKFKAGFNPLSDYLFQVIEHESIQHSELARGTDFTKQWNKETRLLEETVCLSVAMIYF